MGTDDLDLVPVTAAATGTPDGPAGTGGGHVHLDVTSFEAFRDFVDTIGFEEQTTLPATVVVPAGGYHHPIGANTWTHRTGPVDSRGLAWFEVVLPGTAALDALRERVGDGQYSVPGWTMGSLWFCRM